MSKKLSARAIPGINTRGEYADGDGLYLQVSKWGTKTWIYRYSTGERTAGGNLKRCRMGLGSVDSVSLKDARKEVTKYSQYLREGKDPKLIRDAEKQENQKNQAWTFDRCADAYITAHAPSWKNKKHGQQWCNTLNQYASSIFGSLPVEEIDTAMVMRVIEPIWLTNTETASRVRGRIERVLSWAIVNGYRPHPNPALWRGNLMELLPAPNKVTKVTHHSALPYQELGIFMETLENHDGVNVKALVFTILTACRINEVLQASWDEVDRKQRTWTIPAERMKSWRPHRVPLSDQAIDLLTAFPKLTAGCSPRSSTAST